MKSPSPAHRALASSDQPSVPDMEPCRSYSYITQVDTLLIRSSRGDDFLAVLVTLRATSYRSMLLIYGDDFNLVYEQLLERCGGTGYMAATVDHEGVLVVDLCSPFVIDTNP